MQILLDTNFMLTCVKQKIDFVTELEYMGFSKFIIPKQVVLELKKLVTDKKTKIIDRESAEMTLDIIKNCKATKRVDLKEDITDKGIIDYANKKGTAVATLDGEIKENIKKKVKIVAIKRKKKLEFV